MNLWGRILFVLGLIFCLYSLIIGQLDYFGFGIVLIFLGFVMQNQNQFLNISGSRRGHNEGSEWEYPVYSSSRNSTTGFSGNGGEFGGGGATGTWEGDSNGGDSSGGDD